MRIAISGWRPKKPYNQPRPFIVLSEMKLCLMPDLSASSWASRLTSTVYNPHTDLPFVFLKFIMVWPSRHVSIYISQVYYGTTLTCFHLYFSSLLWYDSHMFPSIFLKFIMVWLSHVSIYISQVYYGMTLTFTMITLTSDSFTVVHLFQTKGTVFSVCWRCRWGGNLRGLSKRRRPRRLSVFRHRPSRLL